jgi:GT2 family glycosyltransferase
MTIFAADAIAGLSLRTYCEWAKNKIRRLTNIRAGNTANGIGSYIGAHAFAFSYFIGAHWPGAWSHSTKHACSQDDFVTLPAPGPAKLFATSSNQPVTPFPTDAANAKRILIIVPLHKNANHIPGLIQAIAVAEDEFKVFDTKFVFINDSPGDLDLQAALEAHFSQLPKICNPTLITNEANLGLVKSYNKGLMLALAEHRDAILLSSDTILTLGAISEMAMVADEDPLIGFVSPRSSNATICNSPYPERNGSLGLEAALAAHRQIERFLPRLTYVPTAGGFCLYIRHLMLVEFGLLDDVYGRGYNNEENDFIMRCNRRGYRAVLANRAFVHHFGKASFSLTDIKSDRHKKKNQKILLERYPEYQQAVQRYFDSVEYKAQRLACGFVPDDEGRLKVLFDCSNFGCFHNGTFEFAKKLIAAFSQRFANRYVCFIHCNPDALKFHDLDGMKGLHHIALSEQLVATGPFVAAIRLSQPGSMGDLSFWARLAPIAAFVMLDTIMMDCQNLDTIDFKRLWDGMLQIAPLIGYNSQFSRDQFRRRFNVPDDTIEFDAFHSVDPDDYLPSAKARPKTGEAPALQTTRAIGDYVLIVGNHYSHKNVGDTIALFQKHQNLPPIVILGLEVESDLVLASYKAGELSDEVVENLYANAGSVLFPSHYEGFGFPIMHALKYRKPVIARDLPSAGEIRAQTAYAANIHLFATTEEMVRCVIARPKWVDGDIFEQRPVHDWNACASALDIGLRNAIEQCQFPALRNRLFYATLFEEEIQRSNERQTRSALPTAVAAAGRLPVPLELEVAKFLCTIGQASAGAALWNHANARRR